MSRLNDEKLYDYIPKSISNNNQKIDNNEKKYYILKFKTSLYAFILFCILSQKFSYKILDIIIKLFRSTNDIIDSNDNPLPLGIVLNGLILAILIIIL